VLDVHVVIDILVEMDECPVHLRQLLNGHLHVWVVDGYSRRRGCRKGEQEEE